MPAHRGAHESRGDRAKHARDGEHGHEADLGEHARSLSRRTIDVHL
jgi:hypothetical protein